MSIRPAHLTPLFAPLTSLDGVGPKRARQFNQLLGRSQDQPARVLDLLFHLPTGVIDRRRIARLSSLVLPTIATTDIEVLRHQPAPPASRAPHRVVTETASGETLTLIFFRLDRRYVERLLPLGAQRLVSGRIDLFDGQAQMAHPDHILDPVKETLPPFELVYRKSADVTAGHIRSAVSGALQRLPDLTEWQRPDLQSKHAWPGFADAMRALHTPPETEDALAPGAPAWQRLAYDELLAGQLALGLMRHRLRIGRGKERSAPDDAVQAAAATLPFPLTGAQARCVTEIINDLRSPDRMVRLLQGDVGSGKTAVAFLAMAHMAASGFQSAMMAPTELLARQHFATLSAFAEPAELSIVCLTGKTKAAEAHATRAAIADGSVDMIIGTQALFQESVSYARLGLAVIDEQHRFGVHQRLDLAAKGEDVDLLVTTATPIPRTLLLSFYGDMDVSKIDEKPAGRPEIDTRIISGERIEEVIAAIRRALERGERIYWICPLVAESEAIDAQAAEARYEDLKQRLGPSVGLVHGRMSPEEKDKVTEAFRSGETGVLVATTVVEVGVDVPDATVIVIESAERFGLAQLHQLRGRVGRGTRASFCLLLYTPPLGETALKRLSVLRETNDGFRIAEEDLTARGGGDMLGVRQSGMPGFRLVRPEAHLDLIDTARQDARLTLDEDPGLASERGQAIRVLLHLFERVEATRFLDSG